VLHHGSDLILARCNLSHRDLRADAHAPAVAIEPAYCWHERRPGLNRKSGRPRLHHARLANEVALAPPPLPTPAHDHAVAPPPPPPLSRGAGRPAAAAVCEHLHAKALAEGDEFLVHRLWLEQLHNGCDGACPVSHDPCSGLITVAHMREREDDTPAGGQV